MQKMRLAVCAACMLLAVMLAACGPKSSTEGKSGKAASPVLATVDGRDITEEDFKEEASSLSPNAVRALADDKNKEKFLDNLIDKQLIVEEAEKKGLDKDPDVSKRLQRMRGTLLLGLYVKNEILEKAKVTDEDVKAYFAAHKQDMGSVRISHIQVATQQEAADILAKLKAGEDFAKLARQFSLDPNTKAKGGDLGYISWSQFGSPGLKDAAFKLKPGEVSGVVQSQMGYHIMKVTDKKPALDSDFDSLKEPIKEQVLQQKKEELFDALVKGLRDKAKVTANKDSLKGVTLGQQGAPSP